MADLTLRWDVLDGGRLGAVIKCWKCEGYGGWGRPLSESLRGRGPAWKDCEQCSGSGELFRAYEMPADPPWSDTLATLIQSIFDDPNQRAPRIPFAYLPGWFTEMATATLAPKEPTDG